MAWHYDNLITFRNDVEAISASVRTAQYNAALQQWRLGELVDLPELTQEQILGNRYIYQPQLRTYVTADASPMACESDPQEVDLSVGDPLNVPVHPWELYIKVCHSNKTSQSLEDYIAKKEFAAAVGLGNVAFNEFWNGYASLGTYGLTNHPLTQVTVTPAPENASVGLTNWQSKEANEIYGEIRDAMIGMVSPKLAISEKAWRDGADKIFGEGTQCNRLSDCLLRLLAQSESTGNFRGREDLYILKYLDTLEIGGVPTDGAYIVWDDDAVEYPMTDIAAMSFMPQKKRVDGIRHIATTGTIVKYADSVRIVTGINAVIV